MTKWLLVPTLVLVLLAILIIGRYPTDPFRSHEIGESDKPAISEAQEVLRNPNLTMLRLNFSTSTSMEKGERYSLCYYSKEFFGPATISLTSSGHNRRDFKKVCKQIIGIFRQGDIKTELKKINDRTSNFQQTIVLRNYFPEQLVNLINYFGKHFYKLEVVNWSINVVPDLQ